MKTNAPWLIERWASLTAPLAAEPEPAEKCLQEIYRKYRTSGRHYHTLVHIRDLLLLSAEFRNSLADPDLVDAAILYHDIVYNVWRTDNEERSAALARKRLGSLNMPVGKVEKVELFIIATHLHSLPPDLTGDRDAQFFLDFDMAVLGAAWEHYFNYIRQIRREYHIYPEMLYRSGRRKFLQNSLQAPVLFHTPEFRSIYELKARENMARELELLLSPDFSL